MVMALGDNHQEIIQNQNVSDLSFTHNCPGEASLPDKKGTSQANVPHVLDTFDSYVDLFEDWKSRDALRPRKGSMAWTLSSGKRCPAQWQVLRVS